MNENLKQKIDDVYMDCMASEDENLQMLGSYIQTGESFYKLGLIKKVVAELILPTILHISLMLGIGLPTREEMEETSKDMDTKILKHILKKGDIE